jgi:hypothetical protein
MYPTSLEYKSDISGMSSMNATYQKDLPIIAIPIRPKTNSDAGSPDDVKAIIDVIDTAFSLIPKGYNVKIQSDIFRGIYNPQIFDHLKDKLNILQSTSSVKAEYKGPINDNANGSKEQEEYINHSGGARGSDSEWDLQGKEHGVISKHYYVEDKGFKPPRGNTKMKIEDYNEGQEKATNAGRQLGRLKPTHNSQDPLIRRNWNQVKYSDQIMAITTLLRAGEPLNHDNISTRDQGKGGTGYAIQMAINERKPVFVYDQIRHKWYTYSYDTNRFVEYNKTPILSKNFAGIGTREINSYGKQAIADVYKATFGDNKSNNMSDVPNDKNTTEQKNTNGGSKGEIKLQWLNDNTNVITDQNGNSSIKINNIDDLISVSDQYDELLVNRGGLTNPNIDYAKNKQIYIDLIKQINDAGLKAKPFVINFQPSLDKYSGEVFDSITNQMFLPTDMRIDAYPIKVVAHAYAKAVTASLLADNNHLNGKITEIMNKAKVNRLDKIDGNGYAFTSNAVFVAEVLTNPILQKSLSKVPSINTKGLEIIRKIFAYLLGNISTLPKDELDKMDSLLHDALSTIYELHHPNFDNENNVENESNNKAVNDDDENINENNTENENNVNGHAYVDNSVEDGAVSHADVKYTSASKDFSDSMNDIMSDKESDKISKEVIADC